MKKGGETFPRLKRGRGGRGEKIKGATRKKLRTKRNSLWKEKPSHVWKKNGRGGSPSWLRGGNGGIKCRRKGEKMSKKKSWTKGGGTSGEVSSIAPGINNVPGRTKGKENR